MRQAECAPQLLWASLSAPCCHVKGHALGKAYRPGKNCLLLTCTLQGLVLKYRTVQLGHLRACAAPSVVGHRTGSPMTSPYL